MYIYSLVYVSETENRYPPGSKLQHTAQGLGSRVSDHARVGLLSPAVLDLPVCNVRLESRVLVPVFIGIV